MITTWILILSMNIGGYGQSSQKIEGINSKAECSQMGETFTKQTKNSDYVCIPFNSYEEKK